MRLSIPSLFILPLVVAGCALTPAQRAQQQAATVGEQQKLAARLAGYTAQPTVDCLINYPDRTSTAYGSKILYSDGGTRLYVNDTTGGCESMEHGDYLVTVSNGGQLCRGDIGRTFQPQVSVPTGSCALGAFTPYVRSR